MGRTTKCLGNERAAIYTRSAHTAAKYICRYKVKLFPKVNKAPFFKINGFLKMVKLRVAMQIKSKEVAISIIHERGGKTQIV